MKLTKILREKARQELEEQKIRLDEEDSKEYKENIKKATKEIDTYLTNITTPAIIEILKRYNMDSNNNERQIYGSYWSLIRCDEDRITNKKIRDELNKKERKREEAVKQTLMDFEIECELGVNKEGFLQAVKTLCEKFSQEHK